MKLDQENTLKNTVNKVIVFVIILTGFHLNSLAQTKVVSTPQDTKSNSVNTFERFEIELFEDIKLEDCAILSASRITSKSVKVRGLEKACLELYAKEFIDIIGEFDAEYGSVFDSKIVANLPAEYNPNPPPEQPSPTPTPTPTPSPTPDPTPTPSNGDEPCENLANHGLASPHLYAVTSMMSLVGDVTTKSAPEYKIEGLTDWKKMTKHDQIGNTGVFHCTFVEPTDNNDRYVWLRTRQGCPEYKDVRTQKPGKTLEDWSTNISAMKLPVMQENNSGNFNVWVNSILENRELNWPILTFGVIIDQELSGYRLRVNGANQYGFNSQDSPFHYRQRGRRLESINFDSPKDYVIDISNDGFQSGRRYTVYRNALGGHWTVVSTLTRSDGRVTVSAQALTYESNQILRNKATGQEYRNTDYYGHVFDLGNMADGDYEFELKASDGRTIINRVIVKVKRPPIN